MVFPKCSSYIVPMISPSPSLPQDEAHQSRLKELDSITSERDEVRRRFEDMRKQRLDEFMAGFSTITSKLKEMYQVGGACLLDHTHCGNHCNWQCL